MAPENEQRDAEATKAFLRQFSGSQRRILSFIQIFVPNSNEAEEILQETSTILWSKWSEFDASKDFLKWACGIARYEVFAYFRQKGRRCLLSDSVLNEIGEVAMHQIETQQRDQEIQQALSTCLESLNPEDQELMSERYRNEVSVDNLATQRSVSGRAIYKHLTRVREQLKRCIERKVGEEFAL